MGFMTLNSTYDASVTNMTPTDQHIYTGIHILQRKTEPDSYMKTWNMKPPPKEDSEEDNTDSDVTNNNITNTDENDEIIYQEEGYYVKFIEQDEILYENLIIEEVKDKDGNSCNPRKFRAVPVSLSQAVQFWYAHKDDVNPESVDKIDTNSFGNLEFWVNHFTDKVKKEFETFANEKDDCVKKNRGKYTKSSKFKRKWKTYYPSPEGYLVPTTYSVIGLPPDKVVMEKMETKEKTEEKWYSIKEFYQQGVILNSKLDEGDKEKYGLTDENFGKLEYCIKTDAEGQVYEIIFPNTKRMELQGFDPILAPNCPYNKKKEEEGET